MRKNPLTSRQFESLIRTVEIDLLGVDIVSESNGLFLFSGDHDLPPMFVPPVMLVRQARGQGRQARGPQAPVAGS